MNTNLNITTIDANYIQKGVAALYMLHKNQHAAFIDTGTCHSFSQVMEVMRQHDITTDNVDYVILTHVHLDHAGGASHMMQQFPNAKLVVHPFGSRHMVDPRKLVAGATAVYGEEKFHTLYGELSPIDATRIIETSDGMTLELQGETLTFLDTPGHAKHHNCIYYENGSACFTGDTLGLAYPNLHENNASLCLLPTTTPVQFSPNDLHESIDKVMAKNPKVLYPTHFGAVRQNAQSIAQLHERVDDYVLLAQQAYQEDDDDILTEKLTLKLLDYMCNQVVNNSPNINLDLARKWLQVDAELNSQGLVFWLKKYSK